MVSNKKNPTCSTDPLCNYFVKFYCVGSPWKYAIDINTRWLNPTCYNNYLIQGTSSLQAIDNAACAVEK